MCYTCSLLRGKKGNRNPCIFLRRWHDCLQKNLDHRVRSILTSTDIEDAINFSHNNENKLKDMGKQLLAEAMSQAHYGSRMNTLSDKLPEKLSIVAVGETVTSPANFLTQAADLFESKNNFCGSILLVFVESSSVHIYCWTE